jgi:peptidoglycan/xylan/chitin deacetylase (PgdA/CDA1 family)
MGLIHGQSGAGADSPPEHMKELVKGLVPALVSMVPGALAQRLLGDFCPIFMLHRLHDGSGQGQHVQHIERCLRFVRRHRFVPLSLAEVIGRLRDGKPLPPKSVCFTIDDGFRDHAQLGGKLFSQFEVPITCFVVTDFLDGLLWPWDDQVAFALQCTPVTKLSVELPCGTEFAVDIQPDRAPIIDSLQKRLKSGPQEDIYTWLPSLYHAVNVEIPSAPPAQYHPMSWDDARTFVRAGHTIAPHTSSHRILARLPDQQSQYEISHSIDRVREELSKPPVLFAYPTGRAGDFGPREMTQLEQLGIQGAVATIPGAVRSKDSRFALPRFLFPDNYTDFVQYLSFIEEAKERWRNKR